MTLASIMRTTRLCTAHHGSPFYPAAAITTGHVHTLVCPQPCTTMEQPRALTQYPFTSEGVIIRSLGSSAHGKCVGMTYWCLCPFPRIIISPQPLGKIPVAPTNL